MGSGRAKRDKGLKMTKDFLKHLFTVLSKGKAIDAIVEAYEAELKAYEAKFQELEAKYNQLMHKHDLVCHDNCQNLCWENEESYCKEEGCIRNYINPSLYIGIHEDKYKPRELDK